MRTEPLGIDISRYQFPIDWDKFASQPVKFVAMRATIGNRYVDPWFKSAYNELYKRKIPRTAYHVVRPDVGAKQQMEWFVSSISDAILGYSSEVIYRQMSDLPLVLDCELDCDKSPAVIGQVIYDCAHYLEDKTGHKPIIYSRTSWVNPHIGAKNWLNDYDWWMAYYGWGKESEVLNIPLPPTIDRERLVIHQTTDRLKGREFGATSKQIDGNRWVSKTPLDFYIASFKDEDANPPPVIPEYTDAEKLAKLWAAHGELHG
jgi:GH25 family lysozyme M1 (1,4-beta-N-acetylmuramidase)